MARLGRRVEPRWRADKAGQQGCLAHGELILGSIGGDVLAEVAVRRGPDAVGVVPVVDLVQVHLEDPLLALLAGVAVVEAQREDRLLHLPLHLALRVCHQLGVEEAHPDGCWQIVDAPETV